MGARVSSVLVESIDEYFVQEDSSFSYADMRACADQLSLVVEQEMVSFADFMYAQLFDALAPSRGSSYDAFFHLYEAFSLSPAVFVRGDSLSVADQGLSLKRSIAARRSFKELDYDLVAPREFDDGVISLGVGDACLLHASFPTDRSWFVDYSRVREVGVRSYEQAAHHLSESVPRWARASSYLSDNFLSTQESLQGLRDEFFSS